MVQYTPASDKFVHKVSVDFKRRAVNEQIHVVQYDNSLPIIAVSLFSDYMPYSIPANAEGNIRIKKKDGTYVYNPALGCNSDGTVLYFEVTHQITTFPGVLEPIIEIRIGTMVAASGTIKVEVDKNPIQSGDIESTNEYKTIQGYVEVVKENARNAKLSEDNAKISENNARTSENNAKTSETNSKASETAAANSANDASNSASAAATSAEKAKTSETNAKTSETASKTSETNAKASENAAKTSETNSANSASAAGTSASKAAESETKAKTSETNSKASETSAASSATNADNSAFAASTSETNAANSASSAAGSASAASTSESNAAASADNAEESANMAKMYAQQAKDTDISNLINQLAGYKITTKMEDSDGNYVTDANGDYIETVVLLANPDDLLSILERVVALEKAVYEK